MKYLAAIILLLAAALSGCSTPTPTAPTQADMHALRVRLNAEHGTRREEWPPESRALWESAFARYLAAN